MITRFLQERINAFQPYHTDKSMTYEDGLMLLAALRFHEYTGDDFYFDFLRRYLEFHIDADGTIAHYRLEDYNIDNILAGRVLFYMADHTDDRRYELAAARLRQQLATQPRTESGSFWHKLRYPNQIWLDGLYMGQPYYLEYANRHGEPGVSADVMNQVENVRRFLWDDARRLYVHAYDESRKMPWADPVTGHSPNVWLRSVGWFAMALVDLAALFAGRDDQAKNRLAALLNELLAGMIPQRDAKTAMWFQIVDRPTFTGNYLETSGSAMLAYAMLKGVRIGILDPKFAEQANLTLKGIENHYLRQDDHGFVLGGTCAVAGLDGERRNGSIEYYLSERIAENEIKGIAPYFYCFIEKYLLGKN
ncbi:MAG: glycoside hydrolase family 88 protein [bacterium]